MKLKIGAYARISLDGEGEGLGVARQHEDVQKLALLRGWVVSHSYTDNSLSAFKRGVVRPEFERLLQDLRDGHLDGFAAYDIDRIARQRSYLERLIAIYEDRPALKFATVQGDIDLSTSDGRTFARFMVAIANKSSSDISRRLKRKELERAVNGEPKRGPRPFGYQADQMHLDPIEAPLVHRAGLQFLAGSSYAEIAAELNQGPVLPHSGKPWIAEKVTRPLTNPRNAGMRIHYGITYDGKWDPIFSREEWDAIQRLVQRKKERTNTGPSRRRYMLTGLLICGKCQAYLRGSTKRDRKERPLRTTYLCASSSAIYGHKGCGGTGIGLLVLERHIREAVCFRLDHSGMQSMINATSDEDGGVRELLAERDRLRGRRAAVLDDYADGTLSKSDFVESRNRVDGLISAVDRKLDEVHQSSFKLGLSPGETVREAWESRPDGWKRSLLELLIESVVIGTSKSNPIYEIDGVKYRFDPNRVSINWKV